MWVVVAFASPSVVKSLSHQPVWIYLEISTGKCKHIADPQFGPGLRYFAGPDKTVP